jgi:hypothetical protein
MENPTEQRADKRGADSVQRMVRPLCQTHPDLNYKTAWGCPECVRELRAENANLRDALGRIIRRELRVPGLRPEFYGHAVAIAEMALAGRERPNS